MDTFSPGDEIAHVWLSSAQSISPALGPKTHVSALKDGVKMHAHAKGVLVECNGKTRLIYDAAIVMAEKQPATAAPQPEKRGPGRPPKQPEAA